MANRLNQQENNPYSVIQKSEFPFSFPSLSYCIFLFRVVTKEDGAGNVCIFFKKWFYNNEIIFFSGKFREAAEIEALELEKSVLQKVLQIEINKFC